MRLLVIATRGADKSSTFYRWTQLAPVFEQAGVEIEYLYKPDITARRLRATSACDWLLNLRCLLNGSAARRVAGTARHLCFDFDDAIYTRPGRAYPWYLTHRVGRRLRFWLSRARVVTTSSRYLAEYASRWARRVEVIPMALDLAEWPAAAPRDGEDGSFRIGWVGSPATLFQLESLDAALAGFLARHPAAQLAVYCGSRPALTVPFEHTPYAPGADRAFIRSLDVGLLPMARDPFAMGKSPIKALQYLACSVPVVANRFGATEEILDDTNSVPVRDAAGWETALKALMGSPERRRSLGVAGRRRIEAEHDAAAAGRRLHELLATEGAVPS